MAPRRAAAKVAPAAEQAEGAAPAVVIEGQTEIVVEAPKAELSLTEQAEATDADEGKVDDPAESRSAALAALVGGVVPVEASEAAPAPATVRQSGNERVWPDGDTELVRAVVLVNMFKGHTGGKERFAYKGDTLKAPAKLVDRGVSLGALSKE